MRIIAAFLSLLDIMGNVNPLGSVSNPGWLDKGTTTLTRSRSPDPVGSSNSTLDEAKQYAQRALDSLRRASNWVDRNKVIVELLGPQSFTAGVGCGMLKGVAEGVYELGKLFTMLALAEYYEMRHSPDFWVRMRARITLATSPLGTLPLLAGQIFDLDALCAAAYQERQQLFDSVKALVSQPELLGKVIKQGTADKFNAYMAYMQRGDLSGKFQGGVLFGGVLLDILLVIDGVTAVAKAAVAIPRLMRAVNDLARLGMRAGRGADEATAAAAAMVATPPKVPPAPKMPQAGLPPPKVPPKAPDPVPVDRSLLPGGDKFIGPVTPVDKARIWQGEGAYPGVDDYSLVTLPKGTKVVGSVPGQSPYYTTLEGFAGTDGTAADFYKQLQIGPNLSNPAYPPYRSGVTIYEVTAESAPAASGISLANPQFGPGGAPQLFIPDYQGTLTPLYSIPFKAP
ncbi:hypothetical protein SAMN02745857_03278 [Andreprevotia lacus DSM 23236]|jgi:hypothetical protein|uniref:Uncharacterized protein n=1 Tax=Andreprevotia lacus DSM 23236 TaxID=1121001 RepID=A0A1W1XX95_9NEIS|nr:hypothetical protein [Andreprevotia lacus]SMC28477.1 hypothetical protein SAMN02745857_03278 [Andreprevotia lacus DSM 23236]